MRPIDADSLTQHLLDKSFYPAIVSAAIKNEPTVNTYEWIGVDDRLPENSDYVLCWYEYFRYGDYNCMYQTYGIGYYDDYYELWRGDVTNGSRARVIAWIPMPAPPTEKEDEQCKE